MQQRIIITGGIASGKTTLMAGLANTTAATWGTAGILAQSPQRPHHSGAPAPSYQLLEIHTGRLRPWAAARPDGKGFHFDEETQAHLNNGLPRIIFDSRPDILLLDEIGNLELKEKGLYPLLSQALDTPIPLVICTAKKRVLDSIRKKFNLVTARLVDLDHHSPENAKTDILNRIHTTLGAPHTPWANSPATFRNSAKDKSKDKRDVEIEGHKG